MIGGGGPKRTPALAARYAAEFNTPFVSIERFLEQRGRVEAACREIDRDPAELVYSAALVACVGAGQTEVARRATSIARDVDELRAHGVAGTPDEARATLERWHEAGADRVYLQVLDLADLDHLDLLATLPG